MKFKCGDKVRVKSGLIDGHSYGAIFYWDDFKDKVFTVEEYDSEDNTYHCTYKGLEYWLSEEMLEPVYADGGYIPYGKLPTPSNPIPIEEQLGYTIRDSLDSAFDAWRKAGVSIHDLNPIEWHRPMEIKFDISDLDYEELNHRLDDYFKRLRRGLRADNIYFDETTFKEDKPMKFTFSTIEDYRMDKSNNTKIPTITTHVYVGRYYHGMATCDKADYNERQGCLEAIANAMCGDNFDREFNKAVKANAFADKKKRTCTYCGKLCDTVEEKQAHEAWHVERRKARHERYKLRKRAKEIAFEEAAQKLAKEMTGEK